MFRHWRIQATLICFALLLAVIVFWVRSYSWEDQLHWTYSRASDLDLSSQVGMLEFRILSLPGIHRTGWETNRREITQQEKDLVRAWRKQNTFASLGFRGIYDPFQIAVTVPYWFISIIFALLCGLPWYWRRFNFSLRTFFIAFTVLAVLLGFIAWLTHSPAAK
jgi:hypothetical protein